MRIAVIGSGVSGLICARLLSRHHDVVVLEANPWVGGHVNTVRVSLDGEQYEIDTGFIVYNERTYPHFTRILSDLQVETDPTEMSFSVRCDQTNLEYNGSSLNGVFAQRRNLLRPSFIRMLRDIIRFNQKGPADLTLVPENQTVGEYIAAKDLSRAFAQHYLLPMGASIWSCPVADFADFPIRFILEFYINHGLLSLSDRPTWRVVRGGAKQYVAKLVRPFRDRIRLNYRVKSVARTENGVRITNGKTEEHFDEAVFACHSDQALRMLTDADQLETELLSAFPYRSNLAILHTDETVLPKRRRAWASWNYRLRGDDSSKPTLTYNMSMLQHIRSKHTFCVTLNQESEIKPERILGRFSYSHPLFTTTRNSIQRRHHEVIRRRNTSFCGAYWRNGFHEDGVVSALEVCRRFGIEGWIRESNQRLSIVSTDAPQPTERSAPKNGAVG